MIAPARLLSVRLQGFKSFAERTHVEFGPGISAIVGPNGSGKSNLADALRWALGEQGRALRTRRAEDVIWAGSERRPAVGMADVQLSLDNGDGLLPVDFAVVELGRRLYRSGENEYQLNRGRVRLRDLVDLLDAAHLAENAFLFIGQGMVDQALALRPEERRPLFEEVAGVRRHERRRRRAEEQLVEAEANLARVEDILAELRPQARRLAAQAEQQTTREVAGEALADALLRAAAARWHAAAQRVAVENVRLTSARDTVDLAIGELAAAEEAAGAISRALAERSTEAQRRRSAHDEAVAALTEARLAAGRLGAERESLERERDRIAAETAAMEADLERDRRALAAPQPPRDVEAEAAAEAVARGLADARAEVAAAQAGSGAADEAAAANRREHVARTADLDAARRRLAAAEDVLADERGRAAASTDRQATAEAEHRRWLEAAELAAAGLKELAAVENQAQADVDRATRLNAVAARSLLEAEASARLARLALDEARARAAMAPDPRLLATAQQVGGRRLADGLDVEPRFQVAVEAALGDLVDSVELPASAIGDVGEAHGTVVVAERVAGGHAGGAGGRVEVVRTRAEAELVRDAEARGGGALASAVRHDPGGTVRFLLRRVLWLPDVDAGLAIQPALPPGWVAVTLGGVVVGDAAVRLAGGEGPLTTAAERLRLEATVAAEEAALAAAVADAGQSEARLAEAAAALTIASDAARQAAVDERSASDAERLAFRTLEAALREAAWSAAQVTRLSADVERARDAVSVLDEAPTGSADIPGAALSGGPVASDAARQALEAWEVRATELSARQHELSVAAAAASAARREDDARRARAEASITLGEQRLVRLAAEGARVVEQLTVIARDVAVVKTGIDTSREVEQAARAELDALVDADADDRARLAALESQAGAARQAVRRGDEAARVAERAELEARLGLDALRDAILVDLAALGALGLRHLLAAAGADGDSSGVRAIEGDDEIAELTFERGLAAAGEVWAASDVPDDAPSAARLGALRRRFHELGAPNPYATEEYQALAERLNQLESQDADLRAAITRTRDLIGELDLLIADQFRTTFQALESAFDRRFRQLFGGGYARLSLTDPTDLAATGVDIVARPPGKKAQALAMLSGGERALTAVALLFAMLEVRPVPFCVLDEVDAALDEANIGRFTNALRELAAATQFIVITHNRGTIEMADALYGVTVGDDSVSRLISLRLDEARAIAEDDRPAAVGVLAGEG